MVGGKVVENYVEKSVEKPIWGYIFVILPTPVWGYTSVVSINQ